MNRTVARILMTVFCFLACVLTYASQSVAAEKPDIVFIMSDDQGAYDVSWRDPEIKTPNLDKLALAGARLEQFYVLPVCSPTRAALMSGRYPMRYGLQVAVIRPWANYGLPLEERMLPDALREAGYTTAICGKWHLGSFDKAYWPNARGFDHAYGHLLGAIDYFDHTRDGQKDWYRNGESLHEEGYATDLIANEAVRVIRNQPKDKPIFLYVPFNAVHTPMQVPEKYMEPYAHLQGQRRINAGMVAAMDEAIGKIVAAVDERGRRKNTLFIFSSDNGGHAPGKVTNNGPFRAGKHTLYEGGVRVVAFATWEKRIKPGTVIKEPLHMVDWYPTLLNIAGTSLKQKLPLDGLDILPCLTQGKPSPHKEILLNTSPSSGAIRVGDWKLVLNGDSPDKPDDSDGPVQNEKRKGKAKRVASTDMKVELFNLAEDPYEKKNLASEKPEKLKELRRHYDALARQAVTPLNLTP